MKMRWRAGEGRMTMIDDARRVMGQNDMMMPGAGDDDDG